MAAPICMLDSDAQVYRCQASPIEAETSFCQSEFGDEFSAFIVSDQCSQELSYELMGKEFEEQMIPATAEASCLTYEISKKYNCTMWEYAPAYEFCSENYGDMFLPHVVTKSCSVDLADKQYGFVDSARLVEDLKPQMDEVETIMTMIDRQGYRDSLMSMSSIRPVIGNNFYTSVVKGLLSKLKKISAQLERRSNFKIKFVKGDENIVNFLSYANRYIELAARVHKVYAYVAHRNHKAIKKYRFENLSFLNLRLHQVFALEILSSVNYKVKTIDADLIEFVQSEQDKQIYEYLAISEPQTKTDYAKLIKFLGIRENLVNIWAIDRMSPQNLLGYSRKVCDGFLSFTGSSKTISKIPSVKENKDYDLFYNSYIKMIPRLIETTAAVPLLAADDIKLLKSIYVNVPGVQGIIQKYIENDLSDESVAKHLNEDMELLANAEQQDWLNFAQYHFTTIILPGDKITSKSYIADRIIKTVYTRRVKAITESYLGMYPWISKADQKTIREMITKFYKGKKARYTRALNNKLMKQLRDYGKRKANFQVNLESKIAQTIKVARKHLYVASESVKLDKEIHSNLKPASMEEFMLYFESKMAQSFHDIKLTLDHNKELADELSRFFSTVAKKFNEKYLEQTGLNQMELKGSAGERSKDLWKFLVESAHDIYKNNKFDISGLAAVPDGVKLARDKEKMERSPYTMPIYQDGTVVTVSLDELYKSFQGKIGVTIPHKAKYTRLDFLVGLEPIFDLGSRRKSDAITDGTFGRPRSYLSPKGEIRYENVDSEIDYHAMQRLYNQSINLTNFEIHENRKEKEVLRKQRENMEGSEYESWWGSELYQHYLARWNGSSKSYAEEQRRRRAMKIKTKSEKAKVIKSTQHLFSRVFELLHLQLIDIKKNKPWMNFSLSIKEQKILARNEMSKAFAASPLLRTQLSIKDKVSLYIKLPGRDYGPRKVFITEKRERTLLQQLGLRTFDSKTGDFDKDKARIIVTKAINQAQKHIKGKVDDFCAADFKNYDNDRPFRKAFKAATFLRSTVMSDSTSMPINLAKYKKFDSEIGKEVRTTLEALHDDYLEPTVIVLGTISLVALGIIIIGATGGTAAPGVLAGASALASAALSHLAFNTVFFILIGATTISKINTQFYEVPEQLKFQTSLAHSQIEGGKLVNYDAIKQQADQNRTASYWTIGMLPLDIFFGYTVGSQLKSVVGITGVKNFQKLTGVKLRKFSAPPKSMRLNTNYKDLRSDFGRIGAIYQKLKNTRNNVLARLPRYQMLPNELISSVPLRVGITRKLKELGLHNRPWFMLDDFNVFFKKYSARFTTYERYITAENKSIRMLMLNDGLTAAETLQHGIGKTRMVFRFRSAIKAIREGRFRQWRRDYGAVVDDMKHMQAGLRKEKYKMLETVMKKMKEFKAARAGDEVVVTGGTELADDFIRLFSDQELTLLKEVAKKSRGPMKKLKRVFKQYDLMLKSLRPMSYLYGQPGVEFAATEGRSMSFLDDSLDQTYVFKTDTEDIVRFYEQMLRQNSFSNKGAGKLRQKIEEEVAKLFRLDQNGNRVYL